MSDKKSPKEASDLFHKIMKVSVKGLVNKPKKEAPTKNTISKVDSFNATGVFKDNVLTMSINSKYITVVSRGGGFYTIYLNNELVSPNFIKRNGEWIIQSKHSFTGDELNAIGLETKRVLG